MSAVLSDQEIVVMPSGRRAKVLSRFEDGSIEFAYINNGRADLNDTVVIAPSAMGRVRRIRRGIVQPAVLDFG